KTKTAIVQSSCCLVFEWYSLGRIKSSKSSNLFKMVRFKNRYVVVEINPIDTKHNAALLLKSHSLYCALIHKVQQVHGDFGVAAVKPGLITKYCNKWTRVATIRVRHGAHRLVTSCLPMVQQLEKVTLTVNILYIGATLQQCYKFIIQHQRKCLEKIWAGLETEERRQTMESEIMNLNCFDRSVNTGT
ncbi:hypothetical protein C0J52_01346, partial [Blattella germanica]